MSIDQPYFENSFFSNFNFLLFKLQNAITRRIVELIRAGRSHLIRNFVYIMSKHSILYLMNEFFYQMSSSDSYFISTNLQVRFHLLDGTTLLCNSRLFEPKVVPALLRIFTWAYHRRRPARVRWVLGTCILFLFLDRESWVYKIGSVRSLPAMRKWNRIARINQ